MKNILSRIKKILKPSSGFTLIELLIVIAILGILATAVLSAINPVEQINRGRDTGNQSDAEQLLSAVQRFDAAQGYFPWQKGADDLTTAHVCTGDTSSCAHSTGVRTGADPAFGTPGDPSTSGGWTVDNVVFNSSAAIGAAGSNVLDVLGSSTGGQNELQNAYISRITAANYNHLYVYNKGTTGASTYVCFRPASNSFKTQAMKRWNGGTACSGTSCTCSGIPAGSDFPPAADICDTTATNANTLYCLP